MPNIQISQLPAAGPITGTELVPIVQSGVTVQTTTQAIAASPNQTQTFLTVNQEPTLPNSRSLAGNNGVTLVDGGAQAAMTVQLTGAALQFQNAAAGIMAKTSTATVASRTITASGSGLQVTNGDGVSGDPTVALTGRAAALAGLGGSSGLVALSGAGATAVDIVGTAGEIDVANGAGPGNPTIGIADDAALPGTGGVVLPKGSSAQQPLGISGQIRFNTDTQTFDGYNGVAWSQFSTAGGVTSFDGGSTGLTPAAPTSGAITLGGVLNVANGGTGAATLTGYLVGNGSAPFTAVATIPNAGLTNSSITINGSSVSLGGAVTVTATATSALTIGTGLSGTSYNGSSPVTIAIDSTVATLTGIQTLTNKSISGSTNTLSNIPNSALTNSSITLGTTSTALGATSLTLAGLTSVTVTQDPTTALQLATKQYVDTLVSSGITYHTPVKYEVPNSTGNLNAIYNQPGGPGVGVGATLTNNGTLAAFAPDGPIASPGDRILIYNQTNQFENGVYTVTTVGDGSTAWVLTRATDADTYALKDPNGIGNGDAFFVTSGNTGAGETYVCNTPGVITFGTTAITFAQVSASQVYSAGTGLTLSGTQFSITSTGVSASTYGSASSVPTIAVNAQGQITSASNTPIAINGNQITSGTVGSSYISGSYTGITGVGTLTAGTWNASAIDALYGGTGLTSYTAGDLLYASGTAALSKLALGISGYVLTAGPSAPQYVAQSTLSVGSATNSSNSAIALDSTNADYFINVVSANTGNLPIKVATGLTANPSTGKITGGIAGGTF